MDFPSGKSVSIIFRFAFDCLPIPRGNWNSPQGMQATTAQIHKQTDKHPNIATYRLNR